MLNIISTRTRTDSDGRIVKDFLIAGNGRGRAFWITAGAAAKSARDRAFLIRENRDRNRQHGLRGDSDCRLDPTGCCMDCGAGSGDPCPECKQSIYHLPGCSLSD